MFIFSLGFSVPFITDTLCWPCSSSDCVWPSQPENVTGQVHARKKCAGGFGVAGYLGLQPHRRCIWGGMHYLWGSVGNHSQQMYLPLGHGIIRWVLVHGLAGTAVLGTELPAGTAPILTRLINLMITFNCITPVTLGLKLDHQLKSCKSPFTPSSQFCTQTPAAFLILVRYDGKIAV